MKSYPPKLTLLSVSTGILLALHSASASSFEFEDIDPYYNEIDLYYLGLNQGFKISGADGETSGTSVSSAGDMNGDGLPDILIGAPNRGGYSYVIYGKAGGYTDFIDLANLKASQGFRIVGKGDQFFGASVSEAGDVNGDGLQDILVGANDADPYGRTAAGASYVIYGKVGGYTGPLNLATSNATQGFRIDGAARFDRSGISVSAAGDMNGDGLPDILIGAPYAVSFGNGWAGASYVIYGKVGGYTEPLDLARLNSTQGFKIGGAVEHDYCGGSVSAAGDVNGDGLQDILIGAYQASPYGRKNAGSSYVIYSKAGGYTDSLDLASLKPMQGFRIDGAIAGDYSGRSVSAAGDVNGDGLQDILIGAYQASPYGRTAAGSSYVIYGKVGGYTEPLDLATLKATQGFRIDGDDKNHASGVSVSGAGDLNGDGFQDILIGAYKASPYGRFWAGASYVIYGKAGGYTDPIDLASLKPTQGFRIVGANKIDNSGVSVSAAGDVNGDGFPDILIGAYQASPYDREYAGASYVIYGGGGIKPSPSVSVSPSAAFSAYPTSSASTFPNASFSASPSALPSAAFSAYPIASPSASPSHNSASAHEVPWYSPAKWLSSLKNWWYTQESIDTNLPYVKEMLEIKARIKQASERSSDRWFQFSLEDLMEDMSLILKNPQALEKDTLKDMQKRLRGIEKDFLYDDTLHHKGLFVKAVQLPTLKEPRVTLAPNLVSLSYPGSTPLMLAK